MKGDNDRPHATEEVVLDILRGAAREGFRCPTNDAIRGALRTAGYLGLPPGLMPSKLALRGLLRVEIYDKNYRVIEIDGHRTAAPPKPGPPWLVFDAAGRHQVA